jgi:hypothetical protein
MLEHVECNVFIPLLILESAVLGWGWLFFVRTGILRKEILPKRHVALPKLGMPLCKFRGILHQVRDHLRKGFGDIVLRERFGSRIPFHLIKEDLLRLGGEFKPLSPRFEGRYPRRNFRRIWLFWHRVLP